jgi:hypothetical protein
VSSSKKRRARAADVGVKEDDRAGSRGAPSRLTQTKLLRCSEARAHAHPCSSTTAAARPPHPVPLAPPPNHPPAAGEASTWSSQADRSSSLRCRGDPAVVLFCSGQSSLSDASSCFPAAGSGAGRRCAVGVARPSQRRNGRRCRRRARRIPARLLAPSRRPRHTAELVHQSPPRQQTPRAGVERRVAARKAVALAREGRHAERRRAG